MCVCVYTDSSLYGCSIVSFHFLRASQRRFCVSVSEFRSMHITHRQCDRRDSICIRPVPCGMQYVTHALHVSVLAHTHVIGSTEFIQSKVNATFKEYLVFHVQNLFSEFLSLDNLLAFSSLLTTLSFVYSGFCDIATSMRPRAYACDDLDSRIAEISMSSPLIQPQDHGGEEMTKLAAYISQCGIQWIQLVKQACRT